MSLENSLWGLTDVDSRTDKVHVSKEAAARIGLMLRIASAIRSSILVQGEEGSEVCLVSSEVVHYVRLWDSLLWDNLLDQEADNEKV